MARFRIGTLYLFPTFISVALAQLRLDSLGLDLSRRLADRLPPREEIPVRHFPERPLFTLNPIDLTKRPFGPPLTELSEMDLAFIMDVTGSMSPYINNVKQHIKDLVDAIAASNTDLRIALIEYRDHIPEDRTFVTRTHNFTSSVFVMKSWLNAARANGGGDRPEAVADGLAQAKNLEWRPNAAKISVLVTDAPPHGLVPAEDNSFPDGTKIDPIEVAHQLAKKGIPLYTVGCEPSIIPYKDFFMALAFLTGGQYIPLSRPHFLTDAVIGGAKEELSLKKFSADVQSEIKKVASRGAAVNEQQIAQTVFKRLQGQGAKTQQLLKNMKPLDGASAQAKVMAGTSSLLEARKHFTKGTESRSGGSGIMKDISGRPSFSTRKRLGGSTGSGSLSDRISGIMRSAAAIPSSRLDVASSGARAPLADESFASVEKSISLDQVKRLVRLEAAKLSR